MNNSEYFVGRATASRVAAMRASAANVRAIHLELAASYDALAAGHIPSAPIDLMRGQVAVAAHRKTY